MDSNIKSMCDGFNKVFYCVYNEPFVIVEAEYNEGRNWYVPQFLTRINHPNLKYIYSKYPQDGDRMTQFARFYESVDSKLRAEVLKTIMTTYTGEMKLPDID